MEKLHGDSVVLVSKIVQVEQELDKLKAEHKKIMKNTVIWIHQTTHLNPIRWLFVLINSDLMDLLQNTHSHDFLVWVNRSLLL
jgi:hypothetical protein